MTICFHRVSKVFILRYNTIHINKESHKFSIAHYTIFSATERERLHGHNYSVSARLVAPLGSNGFSVDYNFYKNLIKEVCDELDEYMVLAQNSPYQSIAEDNGDYVVSFNNEEFRFLISDTLLLPITNVTVEELSYYLLDKLCDDLAKGGLTEVDICVSSGPGQQATACWRANATLA